MDSGPFIPPYISEVLFKRYLQDVLSFDDSYTDVKNWTMEKLKNEYSKLNNEASNYLEREFFYQYDQSLLPFELISKINLVSQIITNIGNNKI